MEKTTRKELGIHDEETIKNESRLHYIQADVHLPDDVVITSPGRNRVEISKAISASLRKNVSDYNGNCN